MCGVGGVIHFKDNSIVKQDSLEQMISKLKHRGPDSSGIRYISHQSAFLHTRLSIIDISKRGNQPFKTKTCSFLSFNGEIYNFKELQTKYLSDISTNSDTVVLAEALDKFGLDILQEVDGMYAFAYYSNKEETYYLARDYFGIKPLYYYKDEEKLVFASEVKSILEYHNINKDINESAISEFFQLGYILDPDTGFKNIKQVRPGHYLKIKNNKITEHPIKPSKLQPRSKFMDNFHLSIKRRLVSDVPLTVLYSGGVDSSLLAQELPHHISLSHLDLSSKYYSEKNKALRHARISDKKLNLFNVSDDFSLKEIFYYADDLISDPALISNFLLYKEVSEHFKVGLQGDGADELFYGYHTHTASRISRLRILIYLFPFIKGISSLLNVFKTKSRYPLNMKLNRFIKSFELGTPLMYISWRSPFLGSLLINKFSKEYTLEKLNIIYKLKKLKYLDIDFDTYLTSNILKKVDRMSMAFGYEVRVPFLAPYLVTFSQSISQHKRSSLFRTKKYLRNLLAHKSMRLQKKDGFGFDLIRLINSRKYHAFLQEDNSVTFNKFIDRNKLNLLLQTKTYNYDLSYQIFTLIAFKYWIQNNGLDRFKKNNN